jgi:hypothetical protein
MEVANFKLLVSSSSKIRLRPGSRTAFPGEPAAPWRTQTNVSAGSRKSDGTNPFQRKEHGRIEFLRMLHERRTMRIVHEVSLPMTAKLNIRKFAVR